MTTHSEVEQSMPTSNGAVDTDMDSSSHDRYNSVGNEREPINVLNGGLTERYRPEEDPVCVVGMGMHSANHRTEMNYALLIIS